MALAGLDGEMAGRVRAFDWTATPLGPAPQWPQSLKTAVDITLSTANPMVLLWGFEGILIYNDAYAQFAGDRHPALLGMGTREGWPEIAEHNDRMIRRVMAGESIALRDQEFVLERRGLGPESAWMDLTYSPVRDEGGTVAGVMVFVTETTDRLLAERRQRRMLQQMPGFAAVLSGSQHRFDYVNEAYVEIAGRRNLVGRTVAEVFPELAAQGFHDLLDDVYRTGERFTARRLPLNLNREDGQRFIDLLYEPVRDETGQVTGIFVGGYDVTDAHRSATALSHSEARYRTLFETMDEGFCIIEFVDGPNGPLSDYVHIQANPAYASNTGIPDIVGKRLSEIVGDEASEWLALYKGVLDTGEPIRFEKELEATGRWLELAAFRVGEVEQRQVAVLFKDLTARRRAEEQLRTLNATLEARVAEAVAEKQLFIDIIQSADAFVQVVDREGRWLAINEASSNEFERIYGVKPVLGRKMADALAHLPEQAAAVEAVWNRAMREAPFVEVQEFGDPRRDRRFYEMRYYPLRDAAGDQVGAYQIVYDVTDRLREQARLRDAEDALRQSQKMEAVGQLTGGIAHDFNNLLAGISGSLELLNKRLAEGRTSGMERYIDAAQGAAQRAAALTQRLLAFSRRQTLDPKPTDVNRLIGGMEELIRRSVGPDIEVEVVGAGGLWPVKIDQSQLENALLNLCINARDAMAPTGGRLTIETANKWLDDRAGGDRDLNPGQYVSLCVTDTGAGMNPDTIEKIFDPFFTTKPLGQGTGLGLSMIHGFVRQSGGQVRVYSEVSKGTTMCLYLPRHFGELDEADPVSTALAGAPGHGETVLVIDDEPTVRMLVVEVLQEQGYVVLEAPDGPTGLRILESDARIDLLISDVGLPGGMNGRQVADAARVRRPELKVLFITGYAENAAVGNGLLAPGMEVLTKPFAMSDLAAKATEMIDG